MSQVTIYLDDDTEKRARAAADASGDSLSKWISGVIRDKTATTWPQQVLDLAGSWPDFPLAEELRQGQKGDNCFRLSPIAPGVPRTRSPHSHRTEE